MCQMVSPSRQSISENFGGKKTSFEWLNVITCVRNSSQSKSPFAACISDFIIKFIPHSLSLFPSVRAGLHLHLTTHLPSASSHTGKRKRHHKQSIKHNVSRAVCVTFFRFSFCLHNVLYNPPYHLQGCCILYQDPKLFHNFIWGVKQNFPELLWSLIPLRLQITQLDEC